MKTAIKKRVQAWINGAFDDATKAEILRMMKDDPKELANAFFKDLTFGTGGMRGEMGIGTNRMNVYTVRKATQGLANYLKTQPGSEEGLKVFIGFDVRNHSRQFAEESARVLAANGIEVHISREICPTPLVSFACRHLKCSAAIVITASHNPPQYNGYKVYWSDGAQVVPPHDVGIMEEVHRVKKILVESINSPLILWAGREIDAAYLEELKKNQLRPQLWKGDLKIVYSNLHGTGIRIIPQALEVCGFSAPDLVEAQTAPDGKFTNAPSPNPEDAKALSLGTRQLLETEADIFLATDPDADRMGAVVRHDNQGVRLTGNQIACICLNHICKSLAEKGAFPENAVFIKTIVTTELFKKIAESYGGACMDVLTGFKYIAEKISLWENCFNGLQYLFGAEESYGYLCGTFVRDKDAISSCCLFSEAAAIAAAQKQTLVDSLYSIYSKYGVHRETQASISFSDTPAGLKESKGLMRILRGCPPSQVGGVGVRLIEDYANGTMSLPRSDVLRIWLDDESKLVIRPSGTEPKVKIYAEVIDISYEGSVEEKIQSCDKRLKDLLEGLKKCLHIIPD